MDCLGGHLFLVMSMGLSCLTTVKLQVCTGIMDLPPTNIAAIGCPCSTLNVSCPAGYLIQQFDFLAGCADSAVGRQQCKISYSEGDYVERQNNLELASERNRCYLKENYCLVPSPATELTENTYECQCDMWSWNNQYKTAYVMINNVTCIKSGKVHEMCKRAQTQVTELEGFVISRGYPRDLNQGDNYECSLVLKLNMTMSVRLKSHVLDLATNGDTHMEITNMDTLRVYGPFHGSTPINLTLVTSAVKFYFHEQTGIIHRGFKIAYKASPWSSPPGLTTTKASWKYTIAGSVTLTPTIFWTVYCTTITIYTLLCSFMSWT